ncbi:unnamed protein product, partial [Allacma fusca]
VESNNWALDPRSV